MFNFYIFVLPNANELNMKCDNLIFWYYRFRGSKAWLKTYRVLDTTRSQNCKMRLWYYMYGNQVETLTVQKMLYSNSDPDQSGLYQ